MEVELSMPDTNGDIPLTGDARVDAALKRIREKFRDLEDAALVQAHLEKRAGERIREHAQALADHDEWMLHFQEKLDALAGERMKKHAQALADHEEWMLHFQEKLDALTDIIMRREGGPEADRE
jgi:hypothetical protein